MSTELYCPHCRRPLGSGVSLEHGVCPLPASWDVGTQTGRPVDWARDQRARLAVGVGPVVEDFGDPCTPAVVYAAVWRGRALWWGTWSAFAGLMSWLILTAWEVYRMGYSGGAK